MSFSYIWIRISVEAVFAGSPCHTKGISSEVDCLFDLNYFRRSQCDDCIHTAYRWLSLYQSCRSESMNRHIEVYTSENGARDAAPEICEYEVIALIV